jgi:hypothetical protein
VAQMSDNIKERISTFFQLSGLLLFFGLFIYSFLVGDFTYFGILLLGILIVVFLSLFLVVTASILYYMYKASIFVITGKEFDL